MNVSSCSAPQAACGSVRRTKASLKGEGEYTWPDLSERRRTAEWRPMAERVGAKSPGAGRVPTGRGRSWDGRGAVREVPVGQSRRAAPWGNGRGM
ncbi:hypothetical protein Scani_16620 [Streptomyces caniferus]|uniref:Uncharacterized protein n=1 Tax=Streptomyces caniferus TaxID=285557 RepID=A0A640S3F2_9ACTN|nr:hypothetical protein Scani_16620 [Streptomyces caniferus]